MTDRLIRSCDTCSWRSDKPGIHDSTCEGKIGYDTARAVNAIRSAVTEVRTTSSTGGQKGTKLARFDLIPIGPLTELARHYGRGALKYANHQWRNGYEWSKSYSALQRHLTAFWNGQDLDTCPSNLEGCAFVTSEGEPFEGVPGVSCYNHTGGHHLDAVMWHAFTLREFYNTYPEHDDRYKIEEKNE